MEQPNDDLALRKEIARKLAHIEGWDYDAMPEDEDKEAFDYWAEEILNIEFKGKSIGDIVKEWENAGS